MVPVAFALMVTRDSEGSIYHKIAAAIRAQIEDGTLAPGAPMPAEKTLEHEYQVGRGTIRRVMRELRTAGLVFGDQGEVATVRRRREETEVSIRRGSRVRFREATAEERRTLQLGAGIQIAEVDFYGQIKIVVMDGVTLIFN